MGRNLVRLRGLSGISSEVNQCLCNESQDLLDGRATMTRAHRRAVASTSVGVSFIVVVVYGSVGWERYLIDRRSREEKEVEEWERSERREPLSVYRTENYTAACESEFGYLWRQCKRSKARSGRRDCAHHLFTWGRSCGNR